MASLIRFPTDVGTSLRQFRVLPDPFGVFLRRHFVRSRIWFVIKVNHVYSPSFDPFGLFCTSVVHNNQVASVKSRLQNNSGSFSDPVPIPMAIPFPFRHGSVSEALFSVTAVFICYQVNCTSIRGLAQTVVRSSPSSRFQFVINVPVRPQGFGQS